jgi:hypothetical protein
MRDVEALLRHEFRAGLPLLRQVLIYLDPFALFKDASQGNPVMRRSALSYNRAIRWMLVPYIRRWIIIAVASFVAIAPSEALAAEIRFFILPAAAFAVAACIAVTVSVCAAVSYLLLRER